MSTSILQRFVSSALSDKFGGLTIRENIRPEWLINSKGQRLELDFYIEELSVAFEIQGEQHYRFVPHFHQTYTAFLDQLSRDRDKKDLCKSLNIRLYEITCELDLQLSIEHIQNIINAPELVLPKMTWYLDSNMYKGQLNNFIGSLTAALNKYQNGGANLDRLKGLHDRYTTVKLFWLYYGNAIRVNLPTDKIHEIETLIDAAQPYSELYLDQRFDSVIKECRLDKYPLYLIACFDKPNLYKMGVIKDPLKYIKILKRDTGLRLRVVFMRRYLDSSDMRKHIQQMFASAHIGDGWFNLTSQDVETIKSLTEADLQINR